MSGAVREHPLVLAHRGDHRRAPENTLAALLVALELPGCDGVEFDVRSAVDGTPIVLHDETLLRVQGDPRRARDLAPGDLLGLGVPRLADVLRDLASSAFLDIELKEDVGPAVIELVAAVRGDPPQRVVISSFEADALQRIRTVRPRWPTWLNAIDLSTDVIRRAVAARCQGVSVHWPGLDPAAIASTHEAGLVVIAWTVTEPGDLHAAFGLGVDGACVEGPALDWADQS